MQTQRLFYEDCHMQRFRARITGCEESSRGFLVTLSATAFYPEGGGQACDTGMLGNARVTDVQEENGRIYHLCDRPLEVGAEVEGVIDYALRFERMQQHTGEHIVSGILHRRYGSENTGFHMGNGLMEVDFDTPIPAEDLADIEREANEAVWKNLPLKCWVPSPQELPEVVYRTKRTLPWPVRIVQIPGCDSCACCGIHVAMTGEVGIIKIVSCIKFHRGVRLEMVCGSRAYEYLAAVWESNRQVSQAFSAKMLETGEAAVKMNEALAAEKFRAAGLQKKVFEGIAKSYVNQEAVLHFAQEALEASLLRDLADRIGQVCKRFAAVFAPNTKGGWDYCLVSRDGDISGLAKAMRESFSGRGGGKPGFQQGSITAARKEIEAFFAKDEKNTPEQ